MRRSSQSYLVFRNKTGILRETLSRCDDNQGLFALPFGIRRLGTFICEIPPENVRLGVFALQQSLGRLGSCDLEPSFAVPLGNFSLLCSLWNFRSGTLAQDLLLAYFTWVRSLGNFREPV